MAVFSVQPGYQLLPCAVLSLLPRRIFGRHFAEVPFIATRDGYRREGHCKRLIKVSEGPPVQPCQSKNLVPKASRPAS
jgi:hypothetical protein